MEMLASVLVAALGTAMLLGPAEEPFAVTVGGNPLAASPVVDVRAYGVTCDGRTDDSEALQSALDAAAGGIADMRSLSGGMCLLSRALNAPSSTTIVAEPRGVVLKPIDDNSDDVLLLRVSDKADVSVFGLTFDGGGHDSHNSHSLVRLERSTNVVFDHVIWQHTRGIALVVAVGVSNSGVRRSSFIDIGNRWKSTRRVEDRKQALAFCCGLASASHGISFAIRNSRISDWTRYRLLRTRIFVPVITSSIWRATNLRLNGTAHSPTRLARPSMLQIAPGSRSLGTWLTMPLGMESMS